MHIRSNWVLIAVVAFVVLVSGTETAGAAFGSQERVIANAGNKQEQPAVYANRIVWTDFRWGIPEIYLYDATTGIEQRLTNDSFFQSDPAIYGNRVVWTDLRLGKGEVFLYDLLTGKATNLSNDMLVAQQKPAVDSRYVVWEDYSYFSANPNIAIYDLVTKTKRVLDKNDAQQLDPAIAAGRVVWTDYRVSMGDVRMYDPATGKSVSMPAPAGTAQYEPTISENFVAWTDLRDGEHDIYLFDLVATSASPEPIAATASREEAPSISGSRVVWVDYQNGNPDIFMHDIRTGIKQPVTANSATQGSPAVFGGRVAWVDQRAGENDIWAADVVPAGEPSQPRTTSGRTTFYAKLTGSTSVGLAGLLDPSHTSGSQPVVVEAYRYSGVDWVKKMSRRVTVTNFDADTSQWATTLALAPPGKWAIRAVHPDDGTHAYGESLYRNIVIVAPKPPLTIPRPSATRISASKSLRVTGTIRPAHSSGKVKIQCYQLLLGKYVLKKTVSASCSPTSGSQSTYAASIRLTRGTWKFKAHHPNDGWHAAVTTGFSTAVSVR